MKWKAFVLTAALSLTGALGASRPAQAAERVRVYPHHDRFYYAPHRAWGYRGYYGPHVGAYAYPGTYPYVVGPYAAPYAYAYPYGPYGYVGLGPRLHVGVRFGW